MMRRIACLVGIGIAAVAVITTAGEAEKEKTPVGAPDRASSVAATNSENATVAVTNKESAAVAAAEKWLATVDGEKYPESWHEAAAYFKHAVTMREWTQSLRAARTPLGKLVSRKILGKTYKTSLPGAPDGEYVVIQFETTFKNKASAVETVTPMLDKDGKWRVSGYFIK